MESTPQTAKQNVLEHGLAVWETTKRLIAGDFEGMKVPGWFSENHVAIVNNLHPAKIIKQYNIYHDCGKPFCIEYDEEGRKHFPNHATVSSETYLEYFPDPERVVSNLIKNDMVLHTATAEEIAAKDWSKRDALTLLVTSLAEIHSNAKMFGGIESVSFKSKWKKIDRRGKALMKRFITEQYKKHSYIFVRNDLTAPEKAVQASHAALELGRTEDIVHPSIVALGVRNEAKLRKVVRELLEAGITCKLFRDNLYNEELTAVCTEPLTADQRPLLKRYQLLK